MKKIYFALFIFLIFSCNSPRNVDWNKFLTSGDGDYEDDKIDNNINDELPDVDNYSDEIAKSRVIIELLWDKGYKTNMESASGIDGVEVDLDIHLIKKNSLEAPKYNYAPLEGVLGTVALNKDTMNYDDPYNPEYEKFFRHDDCWSIDHGNGTDMIETIKWNASLIFDNSWGGNDFKTPETISLGKIEDENKDGVPDDSILDDEYLIVVNYFSCRSKYVDGVDRCAKNYDGDDSAYEVNAKINIIIDGVEVPRKSSQNELPPIRPADNYSEKTKNFIIKPNEWKIIAVLKWNNKYESLLGGDGIISDVSMVEDGITVNSKSYKTCVFTLANGYSALAPIWNKDAYYNFVYTKINPDDLFSPTIGKCYVDNDNMSSIGKMISIPAGYFWMGCNNDNCDINSEPYHKVYLDAFQIDKYEVTTEQYKECVSNGYCSNRNLDEPHFFEYGKDTENYFGDCNLGLEGKETHPMNCVSWYGAQAYCEWIGKRLPTEAEWEKAMRGGCELYENCEKESRVNPWGNTQVDCNYAVIFDSNFSEKEGCGTGGTMPVGSKSKGSSPYGVHDMIGNVWEWVDDWYAEDYYSTSQEANPKGPLSGSLKSLRGFSWYNDPAYIFIFGFSRNQGDPRSRFGSRGFRCADREL